MKGFVRIGMTVGALGLALVLAGCEDFDPTSLFDGDLFNAKKPLPGERRPVFPEGTPGVSQGVPPELIRGHEAPEAAGAPQSTATATPKQAAAEPSEPTSRPKPKAKSKGEAKPKAAAKPAPQPTQTAGAEAEQPPAGRAPGAQAQWPDPPQTRPAGGGGVPGAPGGGPAWPDPPPTR